jgi:aspartyl/asparaginyl beta-hydroxylase (cupin superfamily)
VDWIYQTVKGKRLGQIMLAKLLPESGIPYHRDPGPYWEVYKRFHVPIITNPMVLFYCRHNDKEIHMKSGNLYQLNNLWLHAAENYSPYERIHVIVDIETDDECFAIEDEPEWLKNLPSGAY